MTWLSLNHALLTPPGVNNRVGQKRYDNNRTCSGGDSMRNCLLLVMTKLPRRNALLLSVYLASAWVTNPLAHDLRHIFSYHEGGG